MTKLIIFDFWGTLIENGIYSPVKQVKFILNIEEDFSTYIGKFEDVFMTRPYGSLREAFEAVAERFGIQASEQQIEQLIGMWNKNTLLARPFQDTIDMLTELRREYKLALLSNTDGFSVAQVMEKYKLQDSKERQSQTCLRQCQRHQERAQL